MIPTELKETLDARHSESAIRPDQGERLYLLVLAGHSSWLFPLPHQGELLIGRAADAHVHVDDPSVSRLHALLVVKHGQARISDRGSHNGIRVNGVVVQEQQLYSGDVVTLGDVTLVEVSRCAAPASTGSSWVRAPSWWPTPPGCAPTSCSSASPPALCPSSSTARRARARRMPPGRCTTGPPARAGLLERSSGGTLFLDEVAELSLPLQAKLLRALDQHLQAQEIQDIPA